MSISRKYTDKELIVGCKNNDRYAQEMLYRRYFPTMMSMCMRYTDDKERAMEIINNGFLRVFKKIDTFKFKGSLEGWIRKLVFHSLAEYFKKHGKYLSSMVFEERDTSLRSKALDNIYFEDIMKLVDLLPPATKEVFCLYAIDGFTHVEISKQINISVGTSKWHLSAARKKLKELLKYQQQYRLYAG